MKSRIQILRYRSQSVAQDGSGWERRILSPVLPGVEFEFMRTTLNPGVDAGTFLPHAHGSREYVAIEKGVLHLTLDGVLYTLEAGDSIYYDGDCLHGFANSARTACVYYLAMDVSGDPAGTQHRVTKNLDPSSRASVLRPNVSGTKPAGRAMACRELSINNSDAFAAGMEERCMTSDNRWEWSAAEIRRMGYQVVDLIANHLSGLPDTPVFQPFPAELAERHLHSAVPEYGMGWEEILKMFATDIAPFPFGNGHPRFYGWVNSPPAVVSIFAEALAGAMNPSCAGGNHPSCLSRARGDQLVPPDPRFSSRCDGPSGERRFHGGIDCAGCCQTH